MFGRKMQSMINVLIAVAVLIRAVVDEVEAESMFNTPVQRDDDSTPGSLDCSFGNLVTLIGHRNFSLLGMHQNCAIFYILGDSIKSDSKIDLSEIDGSSRQCRKAQPLFYKHNDEYQLMVAQKMNAYTGQCEWEQSSDDHLHCSFDRKQWKKHSVKPSTSDDTEIIGQIADVNSDMLHVFYTDENGIYYDSTYNVSSEKFIKQGALQQKILKKLSYDSDRQLMYMLTNEMVYQRVKSNSGIFTYEPTYAKVNNFKQGSYSTFSFSNSYYIIKKTLGDGRVAYYAGEEGNLNQVCVVEVPQEETFYLSLFIGTDNESIHERIRSQLAPRPSPTKPDSRTTPMPMKAAKPSFQAISFLLFILSLTVIFR